MLISDFSPLGVKFPPSYQRNTLYVKPCRTTVTQQHSGYVKSNANRQMWRESKWSWFKPNQFMRNHSGCSETFLLPQPVHHYIPTIGHCNAPWIHLLLWFPKQTPMVRLVLTISFPSQLVSLGKLPDSLMGFTKHLSSWTLSHLSISPLSPYTVLYMLAATKSNSFSPALRIWSKSLTLSGTVFSSHFLRLNPREIC